MTKKDLETLLKTKIPLSDKMQVSVASINMDKVELNCPLAPNINHKGTVFGGSLYSACALSCYGLFLYGLSAQNFQTQNIVIADGNIKYLKPVEGDFQVQASWEPADRDLFFKTLKAKGKSRVELKAAAIYKNQKCAEFSAHFVAFLES